MLRILAPLLVGLVLAASYLFYAGRRMSVHVRGGVLRGYCPECHVLGPEVVSTGIVAHHVCESCGHRYQVMDLSEAVTLMGKEARQRALRFGLFVFMLVLFQAYLEIWHVD